MSGEPKGPAIGQSVTLNHPSNIAHGQRGKVTELHLDAGDPTADPPVAPKLDAFTVELEVHPGRPDADPPVAPFTRSHRFMAGAFGTTVLPA